MRVSASLTWALWRHWGGCGVGLFTVGDACAAMQSMWMRPEPADALLWLETRISGPAAPKRCSPEGYLHSSLPARRWVEWGPSPQQPNYTLVHKYELPTSGAPPVHPRCWMHHHFKGPAATSQDGTNEPNQTNQTNRHNPSRRGLNPLLVYNQRPTPPFSPSGRYCVQYTARPAPHTTRDSSGYELDIRRPSTSTKPSAFRNSYWHGSRAAANPSPASPA